MTTPTPPDMPELIPCPFCGGAAKLYFSEMRAPRYSVGCASCSFERWPMDTRKGVIDDWNTRVPEPIKSERSKPMPFTPDDVSPTPPADALPQKSTSDTIEIRRHAGNPKLVRIKGLRVVEMPECEGGGYAITGDIAERIVAALNPAPVTDAQREALEPRAYLHTCESGSSLFHTKVSAEQKMRQWGGKVLPLYAALSAPVAQVDVEKLKEQLLKAPSQADDAILPRNFCRRHEWNKAVTKTIDHITTHYHLTPKTPISRTRQPAPAGIAHDTAPAS